MRAVIQNSFGEPAVLHVAEVPKPQPIPTEVLVRVHATAVNPVDAVVRSPRPCWPESYKCCTRGREVANPFAASFLLLPDLARDGIPKRFP